MIFSLLHHRLLQAFCAHSRGRAAAATAAAAIIEVAQGILQLLVRACNVKELRNNKIRPMLRCEFIKAIFVGMYMPLCVDAVSGFGLVSASNLIGGIVMLLMLPLSVLATKRFDKGMEYTGTGGGGKIIPDTTVAYTGQPGV